MIHGRFLVPLLAMCVSYLYQCVPTFLHRFSLSPVPSCRLGPSSGCPVYNIRCFLLWHSESNGFNVTWQRQMLRVLPSCIDCDPILIHPGSFECPLWASQWTRHWSLMLTMTLGRQSEFSALFRRANWSSERLGFCLKLWCLCKKRADSTQDDSHTTILGSGHIHCRPFPSLVYASFLQGRKLYKFKTKTKPLQETMV